MPTLARVLSIVDKEPDEIREVEQGTVAPGIVCKANWRHSFRGAVYVRTIRNVTYWVAVLECNCGKWRITRYTPRTGQQVGSHRYWEPADSDYPSDKTQEECRAIWLESMLVTEEVESMPVPENMGAHNGSATG